jgi:hypothetical protein
MRRRQKPHLCIGFTPDALGFWRSVENKRVVFEGCAAECQNCQGMRAGDRTYRQLPIAPWTLTYRCTESEHFEECGMRCSMVIVEIREAGGP